jgi:hypothetical protein
VTGVPDFWLNTLRNVPGVGETITDNDEPILKYLTDITVDQKNDPPVSCFAAYQINHSIF